MRWNGRKRMGASLCVGDQQCPLQLEGEIEGYEGIVVDQTERKRIEHKMREALDFLDKTIQCSPNAIMAADLKGNVIIWNNRRRENPRA
jgi:PAS domain-containing protein